MFRRAATSPRSANAATQQLSSTWHIQKNAIELRSIQRDGLALQCLEKMAHSYHSVVTA